MQQQDVRGFYTNSPPPRKKRGGLILGILSLCIVMLVLGSGFGFAASHFGWLETETVTNPSNDRLPDDLVYESVEEVYDELRRNFDGELNEEELLDGLKRGLAEASGDEYTVYFNEEETELFYSDLNGSFEGIGAELGTEGDVIIVVAPIPGFPAAEAGLRPQDAIIEIDGEDALGLRVEEAVGKIRGEAGTDVTLTIVREGGEQLEITITRATITIPSVEYEVIGDGQVGHIRMSRFADDTIGLATEAAQAFINQGVSKVILDLRSNSGGFVDAAVGVTSLWQNDEVVFEQRVGGEVERTFNAYGEPVFGSDIETIVLINEGSASASEIVAGALKDNGYARVVGKTSFGKGSVQELERLGDGSTLKVTIARWHTPAGVNIDEDGIVPDVEVEFTEEDFENETDSQLDQAVELLTQ